ncbi:sugar ABC transporter [Pararhizobium polonicum]|uniref:Maltose/maltodextrin transport system permease protein MalG n=1 Tax=Pararhizobium polonicum TaxID=1612624 RepID=A0A1C7P6M1_9HYPH|nr:carbohydrate ABC transporter permease [Pararhizobium polonicum]OBZ96616.1 sugar ABC transporter [Pararhizobium polonicum]
MFKQRPVLSILFWLAASLITLFPIYWMFLISAKSRAELFGMPSLIMSSFYAENYTASLFNPMFQKFMLNSIIIATSNALIVTTLGFLATYALSRYKLVGKENIFFWTITNRMAPPAVFLLPLFLLYTQVFAVGSWRMLDTKIGLILLYCVFNLPFAIWTLRSIVDAIPIELDEAATVDGANTFQVLTKVVLPLASPGLAVTMILTWIFAWNEYLFAATLTSIEARTITTVLAEFVTVTGTNWGQLAATSMLTLIPAFIVLGVVQRHIVAGLTFGAVKE